MKRIDFLVVLACITMIFACESKKNGYVLTGVVPDGVEDGELVYMTDYHEGVVINSAEVSRKKFVFKGEIDTAKAIMLSIQDMQADLILDKGKMTIDMSDPYSSNGNALTEKLNQYYYECLNIITQSRDIMEELDDSLSEDERSQLEDEMFEALFTQLDEISMSYLHEHPDDALGAMIFYIWMQNQLEPSAEMFNEASRLVGDFVLNFGPVKQMKSYFDQVTETSMGMPFIDFTVDNGKKDGSAVSLSDYVGQGKYVLVDFWASWCKPCRMEAPILVEVYNKYKGDRFEIVSVAVMDKREESIQAIEEDGYSWPQILDAQVIPLELYGIQGIPHIILFGPDGTILARNLRGETLKNKIAEVMK